MIAPILIIGFKRPLNIKNLLNFLKNNLVEKIYISIDGPRDKNDLNGVKEVYKSVNQFINEAHYNIKIEHQFFPSNLGCGEHCKSAIDWFFANEEYGIIIEDDIDISTEGLYFLSHSLKKYKKDEAIFGISCSPFLEVNNYENKTIFSLYPSIWGWATWASRWKHYQINIFKDHNIFEIFFVLRKNFSFLESINWVLVLYLFSKGKIDGWDHQFAFQMWKKKGYFIFSPLRLAINIGFDKTATTMIKTPNWYYQKVTNTLNYDIGIKNKVIQPTIFNIFKLCIKILIKPGRR